MLYSSLTLVKWKANEGADCVAKQEAGHPKLVVQCFSDSSLIGLSVQLVGLWFSSLFWVERRANSPFCI